MNRSIVTAICKVADEEIAKIDLGYEMGCLISPEFTPAPDYGSVVQVVQKACEVYEVTQVEFLDTLLELIQDEDHGLFTHVYWTMLEAMSSN